MSASDSSQGLRARKKLQTRVAIRHAAFRLFEEHGYADTTIDQIAEAADVSSRTFYRYFGGKEGVLRADDRITPVIEAFAEAPRDLSYVEAYRHALAKVFGSLSPEEREDAIAGERLAYGIPEARGLQYSAYIRLADRITEALRRRPDGPADEAERRVVAGALVGVLMVTSHDTPLPDAELRESLSILRSHLS